MNTRRVPPLAALLLEQLAAPDVTGDINEEFGAGRRTASWYWRQACSAIAAALRRDVRAHPWVPLTALASGWLALQLMGDAHATVVAAIDRAVLPNLLGWNAGWIVDQRGWVVYRVVLWFAAMVGVGWAVGWIHGRHRAAAVLTVTLADAARTAYYIGLAAVDPNLWALQPPLDMLLATEAAYVFGLLVGGIGLTAPPERMLSVRER